MVSPSPPGTPTAPSAERPDFPEGYGLPTTTEGLLQWADVERRLTDSLNYWLATVRPNGTPHVVPRWGVWLEGRFFYDGAPTTRHVRNLEHNPACALHLENGAEAVIVEGRSQATRADADGLGTRLAAAYGKYRDLGYAPSADAWSGADGGGLRVITPRRALAWFAFPADATRFRFSDSA